MAIRVAAFQRTPIHDDDVATLAMLARDLAWADMRGVDLAVFPECVLRGHAYDAPTIAERAMAIDDTVMDAVLDRLAGFRAMAVIGFFERRQTAIHNSAAVVSAGRIVGIYAKTRPNEDGVTPGGALPVFTCRGVRFGVNICYDANDPALAAGLAGQGAALIAYPLNNMMRPETADRWRGRSVANLRDRARETGCWTVSADVTGTRDGSVCHGCTMIVDPGGTIRARAAEGKAGVALFDVG